LEKFAYRWENEIGFGNINDPTPKPPKGGFNTFGLGLLKPPLGGLGVDTLLFIVSKTNC